MLTASIYCLYVTNKDVRLRGTRASSVQSYHCLCAMACSPI
uniref:Uncharacterized protein n=1 Tax=Arundo donax TaxID=35708 RepID=A0A0A9A118_ARUDO